MMTVEVSVVVIGSRSFILVVVSGERSVGVRSIRGFAGFDTLFGETVCVVSSETSGVVHEPVVDRSVLANTVVPSSVIEVYVDPVCIVEYTTVVDWGIVVSSLRNGCCVGVLSVISTSVVAMVFEVISVVCRSLEVCSVSDAFQLFSFLDVSVETMVVVGLISVVPG